MTISREEYERLLNIEQIATKQRFTIRYLERQSEKYKARVSKMSARTVEILTGLGFTIQQIIQMYGSIE